MNAGGADIRMTAHRSPLKKSKRPVVLTVSGKAAAHRAGRGSLSAVARHCRPRGSTPFETCFSSCGERVRLGAQFGHRFRKWPGRSGDAESRSPPAWPRGLNRQPKGVTNAMKAGLIVKTMIISQTGVTPLLSTAAEVCATRLRRISTLARTPPPGHLALLTRDAARYRSYFPIIEILAPTKRQM